MQKWLDNSKTCPECRHKVEETKRVYLNLVADPEAEDTSFELSRKTKELEFAKIEMELLTSIVAKLEKDDKTNALKIRLQEEENRQHEHANEELKLTVGRLEVQNIELNLQVELQTQQNMDLNNQVTNLKMELDGVHSQNAEINSVLRQYNADSSKQISELFSEKLDLTERLDQFRNEFVALNIKLQAQIKENETIRKERDSAIRANGQLRMDVHDLQLQIGNRQNVSEIISFTTDCLETIKLKCDEMMMTIQSNTECATPNECKLLEHFQKSIKKSKNEIKILRKELKIQRKSFKRHCGSEDEDEEAMPIKRICKKTFKRFSAYDEEQENIPFKRSCIRYSKNSSSPNSLKMKLIKSKSISSNWKCVNTNQMLRWYAPMKCLPFLFFSFSCLLFAKKNLVPRKKCM